MNCIVRVLYYCAYAVHALSLRVRLYTACTQAQLATDRATPRTIQSDTIFHLEL